jgi:hypothetical protein
LRDLQAGEEFHVLGNAAEAPLSFDRTLGRVEALPS